MPDLRGWFSHCHINKCSPSTWSLTAYIYNLSENRWMVVDGSSFVSWARNRPYSTNWQGRTSPLSCHRVCLRMLNSFSARLDSQQAQPYCKEQPGSRTTDRRISNRERKWGTSVEESKEYLWMLFTRHSVSLDSCCTEPQMHITLQFNIFFIPRWRKKFLLYDYNAEPQKYPLNFFHKAEVDNACSLYIYSGIHGICAQCWSYYPTEKKLQFCLKSVIINTNSCSWQSHTMNSYIHPEL